MLIWVISCWIRTLSTAVQGILMCGQQWSDFGTFVEIHNTVMCFLWWFSVVLDKFACWNSPLFGALTAVFTELWLKQFVCFHHSRLMTVVTVQVSQGMVGQVAARRAAGVILEMIKVWIWIILWINSPGISDLKPFTSTILSIDLFYTCINKLETKVSF